MCNCAENGPFITDYLTGRKLPDNNDEPIRQAVERLLVENMGYQPEDIIVDHEFTLAVSGFEKSGKVDLTVVMEGKPLMTLRCARGSVTTRRRESVSASRLAFDRQVPLTVITNGSETEVVDTVTGRVIGEELAAVPDRAQAVEMAAAVEHQPLPEEKRERETRVYLAFAEIQCPIECRT